MLGFEAVPGSKHIARASTMVITSAQKMPAPARVSQRHIRVTLGLD
jgi:hypothetical protein